MVSHSATPYLLEISESLILHPNLLKKNKKQSKIPGTVVYSCIPSTWEAKQKDPEFKDSGGYIATLCHKQNKT